MVDEAIAAVFQVHSLLPNSELRRVAIFGASIYNAHDVPLTFGLGLSLLGGHGRMRLVGRIARVSPWAS